MRSLVLLLFFCATSFAQLYEAKNCVYRAGDDVRWAHPDYDDSGWKPMARVAEASLSGPNFWVRCRIGPVPADDKEPLFVYLSMLQAWQLFLNGVDAGTHGDMSSGWTPLNPGQIFPVPREARATLLQVAVRIHSRGTSPRNFVPVAGGRIAMELQEARQRAVGLSGGSVLSPVFLVLGMILLVMSSAERQKDTLFFAITLLGRGMLVVPSLLLAVQIPLPGEVRLLNAVGNIAIAFHAYFFYAFRNRRLPRFYQVCFWVATVPFGLWLLSAAAPAPVASRLFNFLFYGTFGFVTWGAVILLDTSWIAAFLPLKSLRKQDLPLFLLTVSYFAMQVMVPAVQLPWIGNLSFRTAANNFTAVAQLPVIFCFIIILTLRIRRTAEREASLQRDMDAAREMQRRLVPEAQPIPGFHIETAYLPAKEVGGDFYQFLPGDDGSLLMVAGDVSGKGLDAAMVVSTIIGALKNEDSRDPARLLERLNRVVTGGSGFVTCCCALFRADGTVEIASAGHIPPYRAGRELELVAGTPLGIIADAEYESTTVSPGAGAITFLSDGVVEATNARGELLGFDRLAGLSVKPAKEIAAEAERWGQEDDITVVQVAYA